MVFLRVKKINNNYYYYLVKSIRINGKIRQKVVKYIGTSKNLVSMLKWRKSKISEHDQKSKFLTDVEQK